MRRESGGQQYQGPFPVTSAAGAVGLMQVMPETYEEMRLRHRLGRDPYEPRSNIFAGTAYIREMYERFGAPAFLAAYNAGPDRLVNYLYGGMPLPAETLNYVAAVAPRLGMPVEAFVPMLSYTPATSGLSAAALNRESLAATYNQPFGAPDVSTQDLNDLVLQQMSR